MRKLQRDAGTTVRKEEQQNSPKRRILKPV